MHEHRKEVHVLAVENMTTVIAQYLVSVSQQQHFLINSFSYIMDFHVVIFSYYDTMILL